MLKKQIDFDGEFFFVREYDLKLLPFLKVIVLLKRIYRALKKIIFSVHCGNVSDLSKWREYDLQ